MEKKIATINIQPRLIQVEEPTRKKGPALFAYGFRPFFILAGGWGVLSMIMWLLILDGPLESPSALPSSWWHGHEMLFGFVVAAAAGFLLTAVTNWTQSPPLSGYPLMILAGIWLAGRELMWLSPEGALWVVAIVDLAFLLGLTVAIAIPVIRTKKHHQMVFPAMMGLMWIANLLFHLEWLAITQETAVTGLRLGINTMVWVIVVFGGRMLPSFTQNAFAGRKTNAKVLAWPMVELAAVWSIAVVICVDVLFPDHWATGFVFWVTALVHAIRLAGWMPHKTLGQPIVWVLHLGYAWLVAGFILRGIAVLTDWMIPSTAFHAITVGMFGVTILGIMTRVSLAHTGRALNPSRVIIFVFVMVALAAAIRLDLVALSYEWAVTLSGIAWIIAFSVFTWKFFPVLVRPRIDGRPG